MHRRSPFDYWLIDDALPEAVCDRLTALPFALPTAPTFVAAPVAVPALNVIEFTPVAFEKSMPAPAPTERMTTFSMPARVGATAAVASEAFSVSVPRPPVSVPLKSQPCGLQIQCDVTE